MGLPRAFEPAIAISIHEQVYRYKQLLLHPEWCPTDLESDGLYTPRKISKDSTHASSMARKVGNHKTSSHDDNSDVLNKKNAPKPNKSKTCIWALPPIRRILRNDTEKGI